MNLNKILKSFKQLDRKHAIINKRFSSKNKNNYVYK